MGALSSAIGKTQVTDVHSANVFCVHNILCVCLKCVAAPSFQPLDKHSKGQRGAKHLTETPGVGEVWRGVAPRHALCWGQGGSAFILALGVDISRCSQLEGAG